MTLKKMKMKTYYIKDPIRRKILNKVLKEPINNLTKNNNIHKVKIKYKLRITSMIQLISNSRIAILMMKIMILMLNLINRNW